MKKLAILGLAVVAGAANAVVYQYDDGTSENALGLSAGGTITWGNQFTTVAGGELITSIDMAWGNSTASLNGTAVTIHLWSDPNGDGNPTDAISLSSLATTVTTAGTAAFVNYDIPDVTLATGQNFFAGAVITHAQGQFPASFDTTAPIAVRSWISTAGNWGGSVFEISGIGFPGDWMIRANGSAVPEPATLAVLGLGALGLVRRRRKA